MKYNDACIMKQGRLMLRTGVCCTSQSMFVEKYPPGKDLYDKNDWWLPYFYVILWAGEGTN